jgi:hypothetical protein
MKELSKSLFNTKYSELDKAKLTAKLINERNKLLGFSTVEVFEDDEDVVEEQVPTIEEEMEPEEDIPIPDEEEEAFEGAPPADTGRREEAPVLPVVPPVEQRERTLWERTSTTTVKELQDALRAKFGLTDAQIDLIKPGNGKRIEPLIKKLNDLEEAQ